MALRDITLGQYFPGNTAVHRLDPRTKLLCTILYIVVLFLARGPVGLCSRGRRRGYCYRKTRWLQDLKRKTLTALITLDCILYLVGYCILQVLKSI